MKRREKLLASLLLIALSALLQETPRVQANTPPPWTVSLDALSTGPTDATIETTNNPRGFLTIGVIVNASSTHPINNVFAWQFGIIYDNTTDRPVNVTARDNVHLGAQTGPGNPNWAGVNAGGNSILAAGIVSIDATHQEILVGFTLTGSGPGVTLGPTLGPTVQGNLLAYVNFTIIQNQIATFTLRGSDTVFLDGSSTHSTIPNINSGAGITENQMANPDFTIRSNPSTLTIPQGTSQTSAITLGSQGNFNGTISLSANPPGSITTKFTPPSVTLQENSATSTLNVTASPSASPGTYTLTVTGTNGTRPHSTSLTIQIKAPDFNIAITSTYIKLVQGLHGLVNVTVTSLNTFSGNVTLGITGPSPGPSITPTNRILQVGLGAIVLSSLNVTTSGVSPGNYTFTVTAQGLTPSGSALAHTAQLTVVVTAAPSSFPASQVIITGIIAAVAIIGAVVYLTMRGRKPTEKAKQPGKQVRPNPPRKTRRALHPGTLLTRTIIRTTTMN